VAIVVYVCLRFSNWVLFSLALIYTFSGIWARAAYSWQRRRRQPRGATDSAQSAAAPEPDPYRPS
jgi:CDP-diacylglycerol---serine O-phosphatidyltransferase